MKKQKVLSLILAAALCVSTPASAMVAEFSSGSENDAVQVTTEAATEEAFTDSIDATEETTANADVTEFVPEVNDEDATLNAEAGSDIDSATEISLKTRYSGLLPDKGAVDFYKFTLNSAGTLTISGTVKGDIGLRWRIYNDLGVEIDAHGNYYDDGSTGIGSFSPSVNLTKGEYYLSASKFSSNRSGSYIFNLGFKSANESIPEDQGGSNNTLDDADDISLNKTYKGQIAKNDETDCYKFTVPKDEKVKMIWKGLQYNYWRLYDSIGKELHSGSGDLFEREWELETGDYYLQVWNGSNYQFTLQTHTHKWKNQLVKATLTQNGTITPVCSSCGETGKVRTVYYPKTIRLSKTKYNYNGYAQKPTVKVVGSDGKVISPTYYKVTYSKGLTARGTYAVKITFKGKYSGSIKKYFKIV